MPARRRLCRADQGIAGAPHSSAPAETTHQASALMFSCGASRIGVALSAEDRVRLDPTDLQPRGRETSQGTI